MVQVVGQVADVPLHTYVEHVGLPLLPAGIREQVPTLPVRLQALHEPLHVLLQHTPSTQLVLAHWADAEHAAPLASLGTHTPALQ